MAKDVIVKISKAATVGKSGFGIPLILASKAAADVEYATYKNIDRVGLVFNESTDVYQTAKLLFMQANAPKEIAICADVEDAVTAIGKLANQAWRQLIAVVGTGDSTAAEIAAAIEDLDGKMNYWTVTDTSDVAALTENERTVLFFYDVATDYVQPVAAVVGAAAGRIPGSFTYKNLVLRGLEPVTSLADLDVELLHESGAITVLKKAGDIVTSEGVTAAGEYVDIVDSIDWVTSNMEYDVQKLLNVSDKIPYTDTGIALIENVVTNVLQTAYINGIVAEENGAALYTTNFPGRSETTVEDRAERSYTYGSFTFTVAGAIHSVEVTGELIV